MKGRIGLRSFRIGKKQDILEVEPTANHCQQQAHQQPSSGRLSQRHRPYVIFFHTQLHPSLGPAFVISPPRTIGLFHTAQIHFEPFILTLDLQLHNPTARYQSTAYQKSEKRFRSVRKTPGFSSSYREQGKKENEIEGDGEGEGATCILGQTC